MFQLFYDGIQQDVQAALVAPILCALARLLFIVIDRPKKTPIGEWCKWYECFRYGFWLGMDLNAYLFLALVLLVSLPGAFIPAYHAVGDTVRIALSSLYGLAIYLAFFGKPIFYHQFHDIFNDTVWLGRKAEKHNLLDIFLHQYHGRWILLGIVPFLACCGLFVRALLALPEIPYPTFEPYALQVGFNVFVVIFMTLAFYFVRYGGALNHRNKPEWDEIPSIVKRDTFMARATVDDLEALKLVLKRPASSLLQKSEKEDAAAIESVVPEAARGSWCKLPSPMEVLRREAAGARITPPSKIFLIVVESYSQMPLDDIYAPYHIMDGMRRFEADPHTASLANFLPAGMVSRPAIVGLMTGLFDARLELNEREPFWRAELPFTLPRLMKRLGYASTYWYGGNPTNGSFDKYAPAVGFDRVMGAVDFCPPDSPRTWVGIYDHVFLDHAARLIEEEGGERALHFVYTTTNHGPYQIPVENLGYDAEQVMPEVPAAVRHDHKKQRMLGTFWYTDQVVHRFIQRMLAAYPDALFIVTGDHSHMPIRPADTLARQEVTLRETFCTSFAMHHRELSQELFAGNTVGSHMHILPTLAELIAPKGFPYASLFPSLLSPIDYVVTPYHWLTRGGGGTSRRPRIRAPGRTERARHAEGRARRQGPLRQRDRGI